MQNEDNFPPNATQTPGYTPQQNTNLLYAGEHFDSDSQQYYNRARWYNPANGLFNRLDPYSGNNSDPQSLHKYLYAHCNPINNIDPTGQFSIMDVSVTMVIMLTLFSVNIVNTPGPGDITVRDRSGDMLVDFYICMIAAPAIVIGRHILRKIVRIGRPARLTQDINVNPKSPKAKSLKRPISNSPTQNARLQDDIARLKAQGYKNFRVDQHQINANNVRVGINRPDLQCTSLSKKRLYVEYDRRISARGLMHKERILANDPDGTVMLITHL